MPFPPVPAYSNHFLGRIYTDIYIGHEYNNNATIFGQLVHVSDP